MTGDGAIALTVECTAGRANLLVDGQLPLASLLAPLAAAAGADPAADWEITEGQRRLQPHTFTLTELGVVAGAVLRLCPCAASGPATTAHGN